MKKVKPLSKFKINGIISNKGIIIVEMEEYFKKLTFLVIFSL